MDNSSKQGSGSSEGIDPKLAGLLCYLLSIVGGIVFFFISKDKFIRFHALQSILLGVAFAVLEIIFGFSFILSFLTWILWVAFVVISIIMMVKAYNGEKYKLPL